jgi:hypothetical protein
MFLVVLFCVVPAVCTLFVVPMSLSLKVNTEFKLTRCRAPCKPDGLTRVLHGIARFSPLRDLGKPLKLLANPIVHRELR